MDTQTTIHIKIVLKLFFLSTIIYGNFIKSFLWNYYKIYNPKDTIVLCKIKDCAKI